MGGGGDQVLETLRGRARIVARAAHGLELENCAELRARLREAVIDFVELLAALPPVGVRTPTEEWRARDHLRVLSDLAALAHELSWGMSDEDDRALVEFRDGVATLKDELVQYLGNGEPR
jgi:hypothetical protein